MMDATPLLHGGARIEGSGDMQGWFRMLWHAPRIRASVRFAVLLSVAACAFSTAAFATLNLNHMRAAHLGGDWGGNVTGIKTAVSSLADTAPAISATGVQSRVTRSSFTNTSGTTVTTDTAVVTLTNVTVGSATYASASFRVVRDITTGDTTLQMNSSDTAGVFGFTNSFLSLSAATDASSLDQNIRYLASGAALDYLSAVVASGASLVESSTYTKVGAATLDQNAVVTALQSLKTKVQSLRDEYWKFMRAENIEWIGISVAIYYDSVSSPTVHVQYTPATGADPLQFYTFNDADLQAFIARAKREGFKIYLTLAFEPSALILTQASDAKCRTSQAKPGRYYIGSPTAPADPCIDSSLWWWNPSHANYAANVATFFSTYTQIAVKYGQLCQQWGVDMFSVGTETDNLFRTRAGTGAYTNNFRSNLTQMVSAVRAVYSGLLTYDQNSVAITGPDCCGGSTVVSSVFADLNLDVVGVSAYFPLTSTATTSVLSVSQLETLWESVFQSYLIPLQTANPGKPVVFTEFGYVDDVAAPAVPFANQLANEPTLAAGASSPGMVQQQNIYQAFFNVDDRHNNLVKGAFAWDAGVFSGYTTYCTKTGSNLYCKPLADTVKAIYARWASLEALRPSAIFSTAQSASQSFLRFFNTGTTAGTVSVILADTTTGATLGQWISPSIPAGAELQYAISSVETSAGVDGTKPAYYSASINAGFSGYFQHVLFRPTDGTLTNASTCASGVTADPINLSGVHSSLLSSGYPSSIVITNTGGSVQAVTLGMYDARDGTKLGTYTSASIPPNGELIPTIAAIESGAKITPSGSMYHYVIKVESAFTGYLQHLVNNTQKGVITDMTTACSLDGSTGAAATSPLRDGAIFSTAQSASQSFLRFYNTGASAGTVTVTLRDYTSGQSVGTWTSPSIPAGAEQQFSISAVETGANITGTKPGYYSISTSSAFNGYFQHVLFRPSDGTLTNLSTCAAGVTADTAKIAGVHTSLLDFGFPSSVVINNTGVAATTVTLGVYDARDGTKLGTYTSPSIPAGGQVIPTSAQIETGAHITPSGSMYHYVLKVEGAFTGFLQNLVNNLSVGVITDMTTACAVKASGS